MLWRKKTILTRTHPVHQARRMQRYEKVEKIGEGQYSSRHLLLSLAGCSQTLACEGLATQDYYNLLSLVVEVE